MSYLVCVRTPNKTMRFIHKIDMENNLHEKNKTKFLLRFIEAVIETGQAMHDSWHWEPLYYKGIRIKGHDYNDFRKAYKGIKNLEQRGLIDQVHDRKYKFTASGKKWFFQYLARHPEFIKKKWDKKWRVIIFDIPQELHKNRNYFRDKLKSLGFYMLQKSVFVFPYPCEEELNSICRRLNVSDYVDIIKADSIGFKEEEIKKYFDII